VHLKNGQAFLKKKTADFDKIVFLLRSSNLLASGPSTVLPVGAKAIKFARYHFFNLIAGRRSTMIIPRSIQ